MEDLPAEKQELVHWYDTEHSREPIRSSEEDPVLAMLGVGKELWAKEDGDTFIRRLRGEHHWQAPHRPT